MSLYVVDWDERYPDFILTPARKGARYNLVDLSPEFIEEYEAVKASYIAMQNRIEALVAGEDGP